jgi:ribosomal protein L16 Arg81 hydroxylase
MNTLATLLSPFALEGFFSEHWNREPVYISGCNGKFAALPGLKELPTVLNGKLSASHWTKGHVYTAQGSYFDNKGNIKTINAPPPMWPDLFNAGFSLCFNGLHKYHEQLEQFVDGIATTTKFPGTISTTGYLTPPHSGSAMHFDSQHVFLMQISGSKHWKIGERVGWTNAPMNLQLSQVKSPAVKNSFESIGAGVTCPEEGTLRKFTLTTGDILYLPPGFWHQAHTTDSHSLHYSLTLAPLAPWNLLVTYLRRSYFAQPSLRQDLRYAAESGDGDVEHLLEAAIAELKDAVNRLTPNDVQQFFLQLSTSDNIFKQHFMLP